MSAYAATQIPKPQDEQVFERLNVVLWRCILNDPNVQRVGRRGQGQQGVDLVGCRNGDSRHLVGIQCKLKGTGKTLTETEVEAEITAALDFRPALREYFIVTTAPDDTKLQEWARECSVTLDRQGRQLPIHIWGWNTLEERISKYPEALKAFDPTYGPFGDTLLDRVTELRPDLQEIKDSLALLHEHRLRSPSSVLDDQLPGDTTDVTDALEVHLDAEIDRYRDLLNNGQVKTARRLLEKLLERVALSASGRIVFRIKANIGHCLLRLDNDKQAADTLLESCEHAPRDPRAIANRALALLLLGRPHEALSFGRAEIATDPTNSWLAGYVVHAAQFDRTIDDPLVLLPEQLHDTDHVEMAHIDFLRSRNRSPDWWLVARRAHAKHPEHALIAQYAAEAELDEIISDSTVMRTLVLAPEQRRRLEHAAEVLQARWNWFYSSEGMTCVATCCNLLTVRQLLGERESALETVRQALTRVPDDPTLLYQVAHLALEAGDDALAETVLSKLGSRPESAVLRFQRAAQNGDWSTMSVIARTEMEHIPASERLLVHAAGRAAELRHTAPAHPESEVRVLLEAVSLESRPLILVADLALKLHLPALAEEAFERALRLVDDRSHYADRLMVALHAADRGQWGIVADLLDGHVNTAQNCHELRTLATALVHDTPIRERALRFFDRLPQEVLQQPFYLRACGLMHYNRGDLPGAETWLGKALTAAPTDLTALLALLGVYRRQHRSDEIVARLVPLDPGLMSGSAEQKMLLAQELRLAGRTSEALALAYRTLGEAANNPKVALCYFWIILSDTSGTVTSPPVVESDCWVRLEQIETRETFSFFLEQGECRPADSVLNPSHPIAAASMGLAVGECFDQPTAVGEPTRWRVAEIKHKYLQALHDVMAHFQTRFPDAQGLWRVKVNKGDVTPLLDEVRKTAERNRKLADLYLEKHLPLVVTTAILGVDVISFASYIRQHDHMIDTCLGTIPERLAAGDLISHECRKKEGHAGVVLDTYTLWVILELNVGDVLRRLFGRLIIPRSVIDDFDVMVARACEGIGDSEVMTLAWHEGEYTRQIVTAEDWAQHVRFLKARRTEAERLCDVRPVLAPDHLPPVAKLVTDEFGANLLDAAYLAAEEDGLLLSEDRFYRDWAAQLLGVQGIWLLSALDAARTAGLIAPDHFARAVNGLARFRHRHVTTDAQTLLTAFKLDETEPLLNFQSLADFIGAPHADIPAHVAVVRGFLAALWALEDIDDLRRCRATGIVLERLLRNRTEDWVKIIAYIRIAASPLLVTYVDMWVIGHFLPLASVREQERQWIQCAAKRE